MKIYYVYATYDSGCHEKGFYKSPPFRRMADADNFRTQLNGAWDSGDEFSGGPFPPRIIEEEVIESPIDFNPNKNYLHTVYT